MAGYLRKMTASPTHHYPGTDAQCRRPSLGPSFAQAYLGGDFLTAESDSSFPQTCQSASSAGKGSTRAESRLKRALQCARAPSL